VEASPRPQQPPFGLVRNPRLVGLGTGAAVLVGAAVVLVPGRFALVAAAVLGLAVALVLLERPAVVLAGVLAAAVLFENESQSLVPAVSEFYRGPPSALDLMLGVVIAGLAVHVVSRRTTLLLPGRFTLPLVLLATGACAGIVNGRLADANRAALLIDLRGVVYLVVVPVLVASLLSTPRAVRLAVGAAAVIALVKGLEGLATWALGAGRSVEGTTLTFYAAGANFFLVLFVAGVVAALVMRVPVPLWTKLAALLGVAVIVLSFRRSFWIALPVATFGAVLVASGARLRLLVVPAVAVLAVASYVAVTTYGGPQLSGPVAERFQELSPTHVRSDPFDRYRFDEAKNVRAELRAHPLAGIGLGVPWTVRYPLPVELDGGRYYTHVVLFWFWLKLGLAGAVAYVWLMVAAVAAGLRIWRRHADPLVRAAAVAVAATLPALAVAETTGSFTGADPRFSVIVGGIVGWLAAAAAQAHRPDRASDVRQPGAA
jgi:hypothetical protein